ncbi:MAG: hypothetical protein HDR25_07200 [Lachnospiraceae bacterium]|nr:hypothetical protein [Lachnospiraceae bacterium]
MKGLIRQQQRIHVKNTCDPSEIHLGDCIQYDISPEQLLRSYHKGLLHEGVSPVYTTHASTMDNHYFVAMGENKEYYISLVVPPEFQEELQQFIDGETKTYHVYGRIEKLNLKPAYDDSVKEGLIYCTGIRDTTKLKQMVSEKYQLKIIDPNKKESMWYKGLIFFIVGILGVLVSIEKKRDRVR